MAAHLGNSANLNAPSPSQVAGNGTNGSNGSSMGANGHKPSNGTPAPSLARRPILYVGQLSQQINQAVLGEVFSSVGTVLSTKVIVDRNMQNTNGLNYGFVEFSDVRSAEAALATLNGRKLYDVEIKIDWAANSLGHANESSGGLQTAGMALKENTSNHFHVFVGDLAPEINDSMLRQAFSTFATLSEARVMWDMSSGRSRGYGFVAFRERTDAEQAIATMNGEWLGSRAIRVNWANQKSSGGVGAAAMMAGNTQQTAAAALAGHDLLHPGASRSAAVAAALGGMASLGATSLPPTSGAVSGTPITYEQALASAAPHNTTVYVGNIPPFATQNDLIPMFAQYGYIVEVRMQPDRGFAFIKLDTHENAASAIVNLAGQIVCGRPIKCGWGKDRNESAMLNVLRQNIQLGSYGAISPVQALYSMPQFAFPGGFAFNQQAVPGQTNQLVPTGLDAATIQQIQAAQMQPHEQLMQQQLQQQQQQQHLQQQQQLDHQYPVHQQQNLTGYAPHTT